MYLTVCYSSRSDYYHVDKISGIFVWRQRSPVDQHEPPLLFLYLLFLLMQTDSEKTLSLRIGSQDSQVSFDVAEQDAAGKPWPRQNSVWIKNLKKYPIALESTIIAPALISTTCFPSLLCTYFVCCVVLSSKCLWFAVSPSVFKLSSCCSCCVSLTSEREPVPLLCLPDACA